ncbi:MAG: bifunctional diaminohydroxyphosphoribosylaminopyrimidine deaminase/5-amino-6-(5-phosphoribosylamino)uracil reductase RibD [Akkermansiaceae bacterium]|nr:bifunctional diaminohydroxyphosphoribosylaminopyrimidine deaminase/5-amino-6-(5-phosphoribosylamino)uracil reductase RibD [Akkermansiaceae bacterium]
MERRLAEDDRWMEVAVAEARKGVGRTAPNPPVGAVVVKAGKLLGSGWHRGPGLPHAEVEALAAAQRDHGAGAVRGATVYVTLEPCSTHGRTPPCTTALVAAGVARVVYACSDLNPRHSGRADAMLREAGLEVSSGVGEPAALDLLRPFFKVCQTGLPWVIWKSAMSLDGRITRPHGEGQWLTGKEARADVQRLRAEVDAILTSGATVRADCPRLTIREPELLVGRPQPWRVVVTNRPDSLPPDAPLFTDEWRERTLVRGGDDLPGVLRALAGEQGITSVLVEAGGLLSAALFAAGLVDEVVVYMAPLLCGGGIPAVAEIPLPASVRLAPITATSHGPDICLRARVLR